MLIFFYLCVGFWCFVHPGFLWLEKGWFSMVGGGIDEEERDVEDRDVRRIDRFFVLIQ